MGLDKEINDRQAFPVLRLALYLFPLLLLLAFLFIQDNALLNDEPDHYRQVEMFLQHDWNLHPGLTTIPGYHALIALMSALTGWTTPAAARFFTFLLSLCAFGTFYLVARLLCGRFAPVPTLQFGLMPILFPFLVLIYTEAATLLFILLMMYFTLTKRYRLGGLAGLAACLIRQNSIPWVMFAMLLSYLDECGWNLPHWRDWRVLLGKYWTFMLTGALFVAFVLANGGVALGDEGSHPFGSIHLTNVFFLLFLTFFMFLPSWIARRREIRALLRQREAWLGLIMLFFTFWFGFINDHHYNTDYGYYFLRNAILIYFSSGGFQKLLFFIPVALAVLWLWVVPLRRNWWLLYPFTVLALLPAWLVEQRYYLISLTLFLLAREPESRAVEYLQLALFAALALPIFIVIERQWWFL